MRTRMFTVKVYFYSTEVEEMSIEATSKAEAEQIAIDEVACQLEATAELGVDE